MVKKQLVSMSDSIVGYRCNAIYFTVRKAKFPTFRECNMRRSPARAQLCEDLYNTFVQQATYIAYMYECEYIYLSVFCKHHFTLLTIELTSYLEATVFN